MLCGPDAAGRRLSPGTDQQDQRAVRMHVTTQSTSSTAMGSGSRARSISSSLAAHCSGAAHAEFCFARTSWGGWHRKRGADRPESCTAIPAEAVEAGKDFCTRTSGLAVYQAALPRHESDAESCGSRITDAAISARTCRGSGREAGDPAFCLGARDGEHYPGCLRRARGKPRRVPGLSFETPKPCRPTEPCQRGIAIGSEDIEACAELRE